MDVRTFLFDLGNVLVRFSHERMYEQMGQLLGRPPLDVQRFVEESGLMDGYDRGVIDDNAFHAALENWADRSVDPDDLALAVGNIFEPDLAMIQAVEQIRRLGYRLVLLSNTCPAHIQYIRKTWSFLDQFDALVLSYEVGYMKPEPDIYRSAITQIGCSPSECFYTDDIAPFVDQAQQLGFQAEVFQGYDIFARHLNRLGVTLGQGPRETIG